MTNKNRITATEEIIYGLMFFEIVSVFFFEQFLLMKKSYHTISIVFTLTIMKPNWFSNEDVDTTN